MKFYFFLIRGSSVKKRTCAYQGGRNVSFSENFANVLNDRYAHRSIEGNKEIKNKNLTQIFQLWHKKCNHFCVVILTWLLNSLLYWIIVKFQPGVDVYIKEKVKMIFQYTALGRNCCLNASIIFAPNTKNAVFQSGLASKFCF